MLLVRLKKKQKKPKATVRKRIKEGYLIWPIWTVDAKSFCCANELYLFNKDKSTKNRQTNRFLTVRFSGFHKL